MGIPAQQAAKTTRPLMPAAAPAVLLHSLNTQQGVFNIILAMTRRDFGKPAFSLRKKRFVKTHALSLLGTTRLLSRSDGCSACHCIANRLIHRICGKHLEQTLCQVFLLDCSKILAQVNIGMRLTG